MSPLLKWIVVGLTLVLVIAGAVGLVMMMEWPWWSFLALIAGVIVAILAVVFAIKGVRLLLQKRAERKAAAQAAGTEAQAREIQDRRKQMQHAWSTVIKQLRKAKLRGKGDPVTAFPWYLVIGAPGSGKTAAIRNSRHALHFSEVISGFGKSAQLDSGDWYFCDDAVVIDTPGYYVNQRSASDGQAWETLLRLIRNTRKLPALNGLIVCVSAEELQSGASQRLRDAGVNLRQRLNEVMRILGVRCPVYLLVTRCDRILGMVKFFQSFPDTTFNQAMGALNSAAADAGAATRFVDHAFETLREELGRLRMVILGSKYAPEAEAQALLFPEEFMALKGAMLDFVRPAFEAGQQQEAPFLRGIYFSSAHQEGVPGSAFMQRLGFGGERTALPTANLSLFLRDFFARVLLQDRNLVAPTHMAVVLARLTQNLGVAAWTAAMVVLGVLLSASFVRNLTLTRGAVGELPTSAKVTSNFRTDLETLSTFRAAVEKLVSGNRESWIPRLGLTQSVRAQEQLQTIYIARFRGALLEPADLALDGALDRLNAQSPPEQTAAYVDLIAKRIKLQQAALSGELALAEPGTYADPSFGALSPALSLLGAAENARALGADYRAYVEWQPDTRVIEQELAADKQRIRAVLTREGIGLRWLTQWANLQDNLPEVAGRDFWGPELDALKTLQLRVGRAFTPQGWEAISAFLADIEAANQGDEVFNARREEYKAAYRADYFRAWQEFLANFHQGGSAFTTRDQRLQLAARVAGKDSPYRNVLATAEAALAPAMELAEKPEHVPDWVGVLLSIQKLSDPEFQKEQGAAGGGVTNKLLGKAGKVGKVVKFAIKSAGDEKKQMEAEEKALPHLVSYHDTLKKIAESVNAPQAAFQLAKDVALEKDSVVGEPKQVVTRNFWDQAKLREYLGRGTSAELVMWQFLARPAEQIWSVLLDEAGTQIQKQWTTDVLAQGIGLSGWELVDALQGFGGKVWEFQKANLDPFLRGLPGRGYEPRVMYGSAMRFSPAFVNLLNRGRVGKDALSKSYAVRVDAIPTDANVDAVRKPEKTRLVVQCGSGNQELENYNFRITKTIQWSPQGCGDVTIEVYVGDIVLRHSYTGYRAFIQFLADFSSGRKIFRAADFPEHAGILAGYKVRTVTVAYTFSGHDGVLRLGGADPSAVPEKIIAD